jgi:hypothetical protein
LYLGGCVVRGWEGDLRRELRIDLIFVRGNDRCREVGREKYQEKIIVVIERILSSMRWCWLNVLCVCTFALVCDRDFADVPDVPASPVAPDGSE